MNIIISDCIELIDQQKVFGVSFYCFESIYHPDVALTGKIPLPMQNEAIVGSHSVCVNEYSIPGQYFKFANSWGREWGDNGYGYIPFKYFESGLVHEIYYISDKSPTNY